MRGHVHTWIELPCFVRKYGSTHAASVGQDVEIELCVTATAAITTVEGSLTVHCLALHQCSVFERLQLPLSSTWLCCRTYTKCR